MNDQRSCIAAEGSYRREFESGARGRPPNRDGREARRVRRAATLLIEAAVLAALSPAPVVWAQAAPATAASARASLPLARKIVSRLHADRQLALVAPKLAPVFAIEVLDKIRSDAEAQSALSAYLAAPDGEAKVKAALSDAYAAAFINHIPEVLDVLAARYASSLSPDELRALLAFLETPAGEHWADLNGSFQQATSAEGARVGAIAGAEAVSVALKKLATMGNTK